MSLKLKEAIPKFKYLKFLGENDVRDPIPKIFKILKQTGLRLDGISIFIKDLGLDSFAKNSQNPQTNRSKY